MFALTMLFGCALAATIDGMVIVPGTECRYLADDPVCKSVCTSKCSKPKCTYVCGDGDIGAVCTPSCHVHCFNDTLPAEVCPMCETRCDPLRCRGNTTACEPLCEPTQCAWKCRKPTAKECPPPRFELMCEKPTCEFQDDDVPTSVASGFGLALIVVAVAFDAACSLMVENA